LARALNALPAQRLGVLVVPLPAERQVHLPTFAKATMMALGKRFDMPGGPRGDTSFAVEMQAWVGAKAVRDLILTEAERLALPVACAVADLMRELGVHLWLVEYEPARHRLDPLLALTSGIDMTLADFEARWLNAPGANVPCVPVPRFRLETFPAVPQAHGVVFRAECLRLLEEADFHIVDGLYRDVFRLTASALADGNRRQHPQRLAIMFRGLFRRIANPEAVVVAVRAMQAACLLEGWNVLVNELRLRSAAVLDPRAATRPTEEWSKLNAYSRTDLPALCALLASELTPDQVGRLTLGGVGQDGEWASLIDNGEEVSLPVHPCARHYVRAHALRLRLGGRSDHDRLFPGIGTSVMSARERCNVLTRKAASEVGFKGVRRHEGRIDAGNVVKHVSGLGVTFKSFDRKSAKDDQAVQ